MKPLNQTRLPQISLCGFALISTSASLHAQTAWDGGGGNSDYSNNLNWAGDIIPGNSNANGALIGNGSTQTVIYNTATSYTSTGTVKANSLLVGTGSGGNGSLTLNGSAGTLTFGGDGYGNAAWIGTMSGAGNATGMVTVSAGKLAITGGTDASINLGVLISGTDTGTKSGTLLINGGTVEVGRRILMGANSASSIGVLTISSGTLDMKRTGLSGESDLGMIRLGTGNNTVNLDGGTAILSGFHMTGGTNARSNIYFNGTTLRANVANADFLLGTTTNANLRLKNGGLVFDTNNFNVTINDALTQEAGHVAILRKEGTGTLTISGAQANRTGTTTVNGGTLLVSGAGSIGTGATTVSGSGSILNLDRSDTWGNHSGSAQALTIQSGGLVTNGTAINSGFNTVQTLALDGGELRVTGTARAIADGALFKFEAYAIRNTVTVTGSVASSITNPTAITNAGINIGGFTDLGSGVGSALTFNVADVTSSSAVDLTVSAVLKNNYTSGGFAPLSNGLTKTGLGTMVLSAVNTYTGATTVTTGTLQVDGSTAAGSTVGIGTAGTLSGSGTVNGNATLTGGGIINKSAGAIAGTLGVTGGFWNGAGSVTGAVTSSSGTFTIASGANLTATSGVSATGGALVVDGTLTGTLVANSSTTVSGIGTITGNTTISGIHSPGNSPGIQSYGSNLSYTNGSSVTWELVSDAIGTRGTNFDGINVGSTLDFTGTTTLDLVFNFAGSTVDWADTFWDTSHTGTSGWLVYDVATDTTNFGNLSVTTANWFDGSGAQFNTFNSGNTFSLFKDGNDIYLNYNVVPEPRAALLGGLGVLALLARRRK